MDVTELFDWGRHVTPTVDATVLGRIVTDFAATIDALVADDEGFGFSREAVDQAVDRALDRLAQASGPLSTYVRHQWRGRLRMAAARAYTAHLAREVVRHG